MSIRSENMVDVSFVQRKALRLYRELEEYRAMAEKQKPATDQSETPVQDRRAGSSAGGLYVSSRSKDDAWIIERERELDQLKELQEDWDTYGAAPPNATAIRLAKTVVRKLAAADLREFRVEPSVEEGVCVSFRRGDVYADIEAFNSGDVVAAFSDGQGTPVVWDVESTDEGIQQATRRIREHLKNHNS